MAKTGTRRLVYLLNRAQEESKYNPTWFANQVLQVELDVWQLELAEAFADLFRIKDGIPTVINHHGKSRITVRSGHGPGKTWFGAFLMHWWSFSRRSRVVCTAPKEKQLKTRLWPQFDALTVGAIDGYSWIITSKSLHAQWGSDPLHFAVGETSKEPEPLAGHHDDYLLYIVDEASGLDERLYPAIEGAISTGKVCAMFLIGNPTRNSGTFYMSHTKPIVSQDYFSYHVSLSKTKRISRDWVNAMERKYGENSPVVKIRCYGEFSDSDPMQLLSMEWIQKARDRVPDYNEGSIPLWAIGIDVSDGGEDKTVIVLSKVYETQRIMIKCKAISTEKVLASHHTMDIVDSLINDYKIDKDSLVVIIDSLGVGTAVRDEALRRQYNVVAFKGGEKSFNPNEWRNKRVECYWKLHNAFKYGSIAYEDDFLDDEMEWSEYEAHLMMIRKRMGDKVEDIEPKERLILREGVSPDYADATMMLYSTDEPINSDMLIHSNYSGYGVVGESMIDVNA